MGISSQVRAVMYAREGGRWPWALALAGSSGARVRVVRVILCEGPATRGMRPRSAPTFARPG
jgi:hypothetical protein